MKNIELVTNRLYNEITQEYYQKYKFISEIGRSIHKVNSSVEKCEYKLFAKILSDGAVEKLVFQEYLVVTFNGGAISCRNIDINSHMANLGEIARLVDGGYYSEIKDYQEFNDTWAHCNFMTDGSIVLTYKDRLGE